MGQQSAVADVAPGLDYAYALAVWAYDPAASPAQKPLVLRSKEKVESVSKAASSVVFSEPTHLGKCGGMTKADYEDIAAKQFPSATVQSYDDIACN